MQIRSYDEVDPHEVYRLCMIAFGWPLTPRFVSHALRKDPRVLEGYSIYATEGGRVVSQVVPLKMPVRLASGVETVGGIAAVCSLPSMWGKGYAWRLMEHAHDIYREMGLRISTLTTSPNIRGHGIYGKMGYVDLGRFYHGTRRLPRKREKPEGFHLRKPTQRDLPGIQSFFEEHTRDMYGWAVRDPQLLPFRVSWDRKVLDRYRLMELDGEPVGYLRVVSGANVIGEEVILPKRSAFRAAIHALEAEKDREFISVAGITSGRDRERYRDLGYELFGPTLSTAMAMPLHGSLPARELPELFGVTKDRFVLYPTDSF